MVDRIIRAIRLDRTVFEEVENDEGALVQALIVVVLSALSAALAAIITVFLFGGGANTGGGGVGPVEQGFWLAAPIGQALRAIVGWLVWALFVWLVGTLLFKGTATFTEVLRTIGFAESPGILSVLGAIPVIGLLITIVIWILRLIAGFLAVRESLDLSSGQAIATMIIAFIARLLVEFVLFGLILLPILGIAGLAGIASR